MSVDGAHIAIFNHSPNLLKLFQATLETRGYKVSIYLEDLSNIEEVKQKQPDLLIIGTIKGYIGDEKEIIQKIRQHASTAEIPIIICTTGEVDLDKDEQLTDRHYIRIIPKPFDVRELVNTVEQCLDNKKIQ